MRFFGLYCIICFLLIGCQSATEQIKEDMKPIARGDDDEIILVIDSLQWEGPLGETLKGMYREYYRVLPQDEVKFSLIKVNPQRLNSVLKGAKNMIFLMTLDSKTRQSGEIRRFFTDNSLKLISRDSSLFYTVKKDEFARGQIVLYLYGQDEMQLRENILDNRSRLIELFESAVRERTRARIFTKKETEMSKALQERHGYSIQIPMGWSLAKEAPDFVWLRWLEASLESNVFIYSEPYRDPAIFNDMEGLRDRITSKYLRDSEKAKLYISRQEVIPAVTERVTFDGKFAVEVRGLWKVSDASAGGPYVGYAVVDEASQTLYYIEGYVYAPATKKKPYMRELEAILSTFKIPTTNPS